MMRRPLLPAFLLALLFLPTLVCSVERIEPKIPPGYEPVLDKDEQGLWMEMDEFEMELRGSPMVIRDPAITEYVYSVACRVAGDYCPDLRVYVLRNPNFNAAMASNGMMLVNTGLLIRVSSESELASILGHEVAHYAMAHTLERLRRLKKNMATGLIFDIGLAVLAGFSPGVGQIAGQLNALAYNRENEEEADNLGAQFMAEKGYDVHACAAVWESLLAEEEQAVVKRGEVPLFLRTHPQTDDRVANLRALAEEYGAPKKASFDDRHAASISSKYFDFMEAQIDTNRYGRTAYLLDRHESLGVDPGLVEFFRGEMYRQRDAEGDQLLASDAYQKAVESGSCPAACYRNLGYIQLKAKNLPAAQDNFRRYLEADPEASDREMIEFYLEEE